MTPEEQLTRLRDLDRWGIRLRARTDAFPARQRTSPLVVSLATIAVVAVLVTVVFSALGLGVRSMRQPAVPAPVPTTSLTPPPTPTATATPTVAASTLDDGRVVDLDFVQKYPDSVGEQPVSVEDNASVPWALYAIDTTENSISIGYVSGLDAACGEHLGVDVVETATSVTIAAVSTEQDAGDDCVTAEPIFGAGVVVLAAPIGSRILYHAPLTARWLTTPSPIPTMVAADTPDHSGTATCTNLLDASTITRLKGQTLQNASGKFTNKIAAAPAQGLHRFLSYGGIVCGWSGGNEYALGYGYGPITAGQATEAQQAIEAYGSKYVKIDKSVKNGITYYEYNDGALTKYAFGDGYWVSMFDNGGGDVLKELISNAPHF